MTNLPQELDYLILIEKIAEQHLGFLCVVAFGIYLLFKLVSKML